MYGGGRVCLACFGGHLLLPTVPLEVAHCPQTWRRGHFLLASGAVGLPWLSLPSRPRQMETVACESAWALARLRKGLCQQADLSAPPPPTVLGIQRAGPQGQPVGHPVGFTGRVTQGPWPHPHCSPIGPTHPPALGLSSATTPGGCAASLTHPPVQEASVSELPVSCGPPCPTSLSGPGPSGWACLAPARPPEAK